MDKVNCFARELLDERLTKIEHSIGQLGVFVED
jgi:hypothetical protein